MKTWERGDGLRITRESSGAIVVELRKYAWVVIEPEEWRLITWAMKGCGCGGSIGSSEPASWET